MMERHYPQEEPVEVQEPCREALPKKAESVSFESNNSFEALSTEFGVPEPDPSWTRERSRTKNFSRACACDCEARKRTVSRIGKGVGLSISDGFQRSVEEDEISREQEVLEEDQEPAQRTKPKVKKNSSARKRTRKLVTAAALDLPRKEAVRIVLSDQVERVADVEKFPQEVNCYDELVLGIAERLAIPIAIQNYTKFYNVVSGDVTAQEVRNSSAGIHGWSEALIEDWNDFGPDVSGGVAEAEYVSNLLTRSGMDLPPATDENRPGEKNMTKKTEVPPKSKPLSAFSNELEERTKALDRRSEAVRQGKKPIGIYWAKDMKKMLHDGWTEVKRDRREAEAERHRAGLHVFEVGKESAGHLLSAWRQETDGWHMIEVVLDSGAADSVCPKDMCPHFAVEDSAASKAGVYYTGANGGKLFNLGQTHVPICLENGARTLATFQIADVSRPLMSVSKVCEMGNRVIFGANGGVILNLATGASTPFIKKEGIYVFNMWIPPLSESPFVRPR